MKAEIYQQGKLIDQIIKPSIKDITTWASQYDNSRLITTSGDLRTFYIVKNKKVVRQHSATYGGN